MDLDYIQKYNFSTIGGSGGLPFFVDAPTMTATLMGGSIAMDLAIPGGLVYRPCINQIESIATEKDPWAIEVREDFDSLLDIVSLPSLKKNKTVKKRNKSLLKN